MYPLRQVISFINCQASLRRVIAHLDRIALTRSLTDMENELKALGIPIPPAHGKKELIDLLAKHYWEEENPGKPMPRFYSPMLIKQLKDRSPDQQEQIWNDPKWWAELKRNGLRITAYFTDPIHFRTRGLSVKTFLPGDVTPGLWWLKVPLGNFIGTVTDGEIISTKRKIDTTPYVSGGKGTVTNNVLQAATALLSIENSRAAQEGNGMPLRYVLYDIMQFQGTDVTKRSYRQRRELLTLFHTYLKDHIGDKVILNDTTNVNKKQYYQSLIDQGEEGAVLKHEDAPYKEGPTRTDQQLKVKRELEVDAVVTGFVPPKSGSLLAEGLVGGLEFSCKDTTDGKWYRVAAVSNIDLAFRRAITIKNPDGTFKDITKETYGRVYELQGQEWSKNAQLVHARIVRERTGADAKSPDECTFDRTAILSQMEESEA